MTISNDQSIIASLRPGDVVEADYKGLLTNYTVRGTTWESEAWEESNRVDLCVGPHPLWIATAIRVVSRAPIPEPPVGSVVQCDGCGVRYHRLADHEYGWFSEGIVSFPRGRPWPELTGGYDCTFRVVWTPEAGA